jgi:hypothetical protein
MSFKVVRFGVFMVVTTNNTNFWGVNVDVPPKHR